VLIHCLLVLHNLIYVDPDVPEPAVKGDIQMD
jgi:hypothetical protein